MAHRLEGYLWRKSGNDPQTYSDPATLKGRLKNLAMAMGNSRRPAPSSEMSAAERGQRQTDARIYAKAMADGQAPLNRCKILIYGQVGTRAVT